MIGHPSRAAGVKIAGLPTEPASEASAWRAWLANRSRERSERLAKVGTGTGIRTPVPWLRTTCPDP